MNDHGRDPAGRDDHLGDPAAPPPEAYQDPADDVPRTAQDDTFDRAVLMDLGGLSMSEQQYARLGQFVDDHPGHDLRADAPAATLHCYDCAESIRLTEDGGWYAEAPTSSEAALRSLKKAIDVGTVTTPGEIVEWLGDRGLELTLVGLDVDRSEAVEAEPPYPGWAAREDRREAIGLAVQLAVADVVGQSQPLELARSIEAYLNGSDRAVTNEVPDELLERAAAALGEYSEAKRRAEHGDPRYPDAAQLLLSGEGVAQALQAILDGLPEAGR